MRVPAFHLFSRKPGRVRRAKPPKPVIRFYDRRSQTMVQETVLGDALLRLAYVSPIRGVLRWPLFGTGILSRLTGAYANTKFSRRRISPTVKQLGINLDEVAIPEGGFRSFNDFFCRRLRPGKRDFSGSPYVLHSPADCRLLVFPKTGDDESFVVKGTRFTIRDLLGARGRQAAEEFRGGPLCICRLCPADYHRYHFPASGNYLEFWKMRGKYHSVNPMAIATGLRVFTQNIRRIALLDLDAFGKTAFIEVGAFGVSSINETFRGKRFETGDEKGYFTFGGSTVILVFKPGAVEFSPDLIEHSRQGIETRVLAGDAIGLAPKP